MPVNISGFSGAAAAAKADATITLNNQAPNGLKAQKSLFGKVATFFQSDQTKMQKAQDNAAARQAFVNALASKYGANDNAVVDVAQKVMADTSKPLKAKEVKAVLQEVHARAQTSVTLNLPHGRTADVKLSGLPQSLVESTGAGAIQQALQQKVDNGRNIMQSVMNGTIQQPTNPSLQDVSDVMWFLQCTCEAKAGMQYSSGAMTIPDTNGRVRAYMDSCAEVYVRSSSHMDDWGGFQTRADGAHRGIDVKQDGNLATALPHERAHVLFGQLAQDTNLKMPEGRLFLKLEGHGCRIGDVNKIRIARHGTTAQSRAVRLSDIQQSVGHTASFAKTRGASTVNPTERKERIPSDIKSQYKDLQKLVKDDPQLNAQMKEGQPTKRSGGVRVMYDNLIETSKLLAQKFGQGNDAAVQTLKTQIDDMRAALEQRFDPATLHLRIGNEVILTAGDL